MTSLSLNIKTLMGEVRHSSTTESTVFPPASSALSPICGFEFDELNDIYEPRGIEYDAQLDRTDWSQVLVLNLSVKNNHR